MIKIQIFIPIISSYDSKYQSITVKGLSSLIYFSKITPKKD